MAPLYSATAPRERIIGPDATDALIGPSALYYRAKFLAIERGQIVHWNWGVFLAGGLWFAYRRADRFAWGLNALYLVLACVDTAGSILAAVLWFASAALGDYCYYLDISRRLQVLKRLPDGERDAFLATNSGAGLSSRVWLLLIGTVVAYTLLATVVGLDIGLGF